MDERDIDWVIAMASALGTDSGLQIPIVPKGEPFKRLFEAIVEKERQRIEQEVRDLIEGIAITHSWFPYEKVLAAIRNEH